MTLPLAGLLLAAAQGWIFYPFDNAAGRGKLPLERQIDIVKAAGFTGVGYEGLDNLPATLSALDRAGLKMYSTYLPVNPGEFSAEKYREGIARLKGRGTILMVALTGNSEEVPTRGVEAVRALAALALDAGLTLAIYPHHGYAVSRFADAVALAKEIGLPHVGAALNLCHWLREQDSTAVEERIRQAGPVLAAVSINGADAGGSDWKQLIQPLGRGTYDIMPLLRALEANHYRGPIALQGYGVPGDPLDNLQSSQTAWRNYMK